MTKYPVIMHISDLHFGHTNRYETKDIYNTFIQKTKTDLEKFKDLGVVPNIVLVTGDLTQKSAEDEYQIVDDYLEKLHRYTGIPKNRFVIVPGNHDVNWDLCKAARKCAEAGGLVFEQPFFGKFQYFKKFYDRFYSGKYEFESKLYQIYDLHEYGVIIVGFNSCFMENDVDHYGWIGTDQVRNAIRECDIIGPPEKYLRIAVMHHNFKGDDDIDINNLRDADEIEPALIEGGFRIMMHGHGHYCLPKVITKPFSGYAYLVLSTGSTGIERLSDTGLQGQYQLVKIEPHTVTLCMRRYTLRYPGNSRMGRWMVEPFAPASDTPTITANWLDHIESFSPPYADLGAEFHVRTRKDDERIDINIGLMGSVKRDLIKQILEDLNSVQSSFYYNLKDYRINLELPDLLEAHSYLSLLFNSLKFIETNENIQYHIFILDERIENNLFGFWWPDKGFFTISDWEQHFAPPSVNEFISYYIANLTLYFITQIDNHKDTRHCLNDYCGNKEEMRLGMWSGQLCSDCFKNYQAVINRGEMTNKQFDSIRKILRMVSKGYRIQIS